MEAAVREIAKELPETRPLLPNKKRMVSKDLETFHQRSFPHFLFCQSVIHTEKSSRGRLSVRHLIHLLIFQIIRHMDNGMITLL